MLILAIDTSAVASAALLNGVDVLSSFDTTDTRSHAEVLAPAIADMVSREDENPQAVIVGVGPGPFTGLRAGIMTARALAFAWQVPVHGVMSLDALAAEVAVEAAPAPGSRFLAAIDARRRELYWAEYEQAEGGPRLVDGPHVGPAAEMPDRPVYGRGAGLYPGELQAVPGFEDRQPSAVSLGRVAAERLAAGIPLRDTAPLYLRESDARVPGPRKPAR